MSFKNPPKSPHKNASKVRFKPSGIPACTPTANIDPGKKRFKFLARALAKADAMVKSFRVFNALMRRRRRFAYWVNKGNRDGVKAEIALLMAILDNLDAYTWQSTATLEQLAEQAGLVTTCKRTGNTSISRASRAADRLAIMGIIKADKAGFMPHLQTCEIRYIDVTADFFALLGISIKQAERMRARGAGKPPEEAANVTENDPKLIERYLAVRARMAAVGFAKLKARREQAAREKAELKRAKRYGYTAAPA